MTKDERIAELERENEQLKKQLAEQKTLFEMYRSMAIQKGFDNPDVVKEIRKSVRHEICEKIRNWLKSRATKYIVGKKFVYELLDQIEQGEE